MDEEDSVPVDPRKCRPPVVSDYVDYLMEMLGNDFALSKEIKGDWLVQSPSNVLFFPDCRVKTDIAMRYYYRTLDEDSKEKYGIPELWLNHLEDEYSSEWDNFSNTSPPGFICAAKVGTSFRRVRVVGVGGTSEPNGGGEILYQCCPIDDEVLLKANSKRSLHRHIPRQVKCSAADLRQLPKKLAELPLLRFRFCPFVRRHAQNDHLIWQEQGLVPEMTEDEDDEFADATVNFRLKNGIDLASASVEVTMALIKWFKSHPHLSFKVEGLELGPEGGPVYAVRCLRTRLQDFVSRTSAVVSIDKDDEVKRFQRMMALKNKFVEAKEARRSELELDEMLHDRYKDADLDNVLEGVRKMDGVYVKVEDDGQEGYPYFYAAESCRESCRREINQKIDENLPAARRLRWPRVGDACVVRWIRYAYRAEVVELIADGFRAKVRYVDYGNWSLVTRDSLFGLAGQPDIVTKTPKIALLFMVMSPPVAPEKREKAWRILHNLVSPPSGVELLKVMCQHVDETMSARKEAVVQVHSLKMKKKCDRRNLLEVLPDLLVDGVP